MGAAVATTVVAAVAGTRALGYDDDVLRALGARPRPVPDEQDTALLEAAAVDQAQLLVDLEALSERHGLDLVALVAIADEQLAALGGAPRPAPAAVLDDPAEALRSAADAWLAVSGRRREDVTLASSSALVTVLASLAAAQAVVSDTLRSSA